MFTSPPTLRIRSPSSTTVEFTVTNRPPSTVPRQLLHILTFLLRLILALTAFTFLLTKYHPPPFPASIPPAFHQLLSYLSTLATPLSWQTLLPVSIAIFYVSFFTGGYTEESLVVIRDLGVQISTTTGWWGGRRSRFIPTSRVVDLWIHEGFRGFEVRFYLAVVVEGEEGLVVVFPTLLPNRRVLELVWRGARKCLYEPKQLAS